MKRRIPVKDMRSRWRRSSYWHRGLSQVLNMVGLCKNSQSRSSPMCARITGKVVERTDSLVHSNTSVGLIGGSEICQYEYYPMSNNYPLLQISTWLIWRCDMDHTLKTTTWKLVHLLVFSGRESDNNSFLWVTTFQCKLFCILEWNLIKKIKYSLSLMDIQSARRN